MKSLGNWPIYENIYVSYFFDIAPAQTSEHFAFEIVEIGETKVKAMAFSRDSVQS